MVNRKNSVFIGADEKQSLFDFRMNDQFNKKIIIFLHGFMGYKDWGCWNLVSDYFVNLGYGFIKFNTTHNGCSIDTPIEFTDLSAFQNNTYSKELTDLNCMIDLVDEQNIEYDEIHLIGHSKGGSICLLNVHHPKINSVCAWAAPCDLEDRFPKGEKFAEWKQQGFYEIENKRTQQKFKIDFNLYKDFQLYKNQLNIENTLLKNKKPVLIVHGENDEAVSLENGQHLARWSKTALKIIPDTGHTFGSSEPWLSDHLPPALLEACEFSADFIKQQNHD